MNIISNIVATFPLLILLPSTLLAQPGIEWAKSYGGSQEDDGAAIVRTRDGGYAIAGSTKSNDGDVTGLHGKIDFLVVKIDASGAVEWTKTCGGTGDDVAYSIAETSDDGLVVAGATYSNDGDVTGFFGSGDAWVVKLSSAGVIEWERACGGSGQDFARKVAQTTDGGCVFTGYTHSNDGDLAGQLKGAPLGGSDLWVVKLDSRGDIQWSRCYGSVEDDEGLGITPTRDGGFVVVGTADSSQGDVTGHHSGGAGASDMWVLKLNDVGDIDWEHCYGGSYYDDGIDIIQTVDGGYALAGDTQSTDGDVMGYRGGFGDAWIVRIDSIGRLVWQRTLGGSGYDVSSSILQTEDRGYIIACTTASNDGDVLGGHGGQDMWIVKLDSNGTVLWQKTFGGSAEDYGCSVVESADGGFAIAGGSVSHDGDVSGVHGLSRDYWVVKLKGPDCSDIRVQLPRLQLQAHNQDTVRIPILAIDSSVRLLSVLDLSLHLNTDVLTPIGIDPHVGVFASAKQERFVFGGDSVSMRFQLSSAIGLAPDTLCVLECIAFVSDTLSTSVTLSRLNFEDPPFNAHCLTTQSIGDPDSGVQFTLIPVCGEQTLSKEMGKDDILTIASITPNPIRSEAAVQLHIPSGYANDGILEVYDALGNLLQKQPLVFSPLARSVTIPLSFAGSSGVRYIRISSKSGVSTGRVVVER